MYTRKELINNLYKFKEIEGRTPRIFEMRFKNGYIGNHHFLNEFGSWTDTIIESDIKNDKYFDLNNMTSFKWYMIGYLIADGCIKTKTNEITLVSVDKEHLQKLNKIIKMNYYEYPSKNGWKPQAVLSKTSSRWKTDLLKFNIKPQKTFYETLPIKYINNELDAAALLLGHFDGDGSISYIKTKLKNGSINIHPRFQIVGSEQLCEDYRYLLNKYANINIENKLIKNKNIFAFIVSKYIKNKQIYDFIYKSELIQYAMERKYNRFTELI